jgi:hypothetical protein
VHRYHYKFVGFGGDRDRSRDNSKLLLYAFGGGSSGLKRLDRPAAPSIEEKRQPGTGRQRQIFCFGSIEQGTSTNLLDVEEGVNLDPAQLTRGSFFG